MRNLDEHSITDAVRAKAAGAKDPRTKQISDALVRHLHDFVREIEPTQAEWSAAIEFLTRTGHRCDANRQEFILLSDTLGVSMLVDAINHRRPGVATETTVLGPFYVESPPEVLLGGDISPGLKGRRLFVSGSVTSTAGKPLSRCNRRRLAFRRRRLLRRTATGGQGRARDARASSDER